MRSVIRGDRDKPDAGAGVNDTSGPALSRKALPGLGNMRQLPASLFAQPGSSVTRSDPPRWTTAMPTNTVARSRPARTSAKATTG
jgi:hypothetical protein